MMKTFLIIAAIMVCVHGNPAAIISNEAQSDKIFDELNEIGEKLDEIIVEVQDQSIAHDISKAPESDEVTKRSTCKDIMGEDWCKNLLKQHASKCAIASYRTFFEKRCYKSCGYCTGGSVVSPATTRASTCKDIMGEDWCKNLLKQHASKCAIASYRTFFEKRCYKSCGYCPGGSVVKPAPTQAPRGTGVLSEDCLTAHNEKRAKHVDTPAQHWDAKLARGSQKWAEKLARLGRSKHSEGPYGENLYWSSANSVNCYDAVDNWYGEIKDYNFETGRSTGGAVGHFTQVVWKPSIKIGCGIAGNTYVVCRYKVTGNFVSRKWREDREHAHRRVYRANVEKLKSSGDEQEDDVAARDEYKEIITPYDHVHQDIAATEDEEKYAVAARDEEEDLDTKFESN